jgi:hypothetical protein
MPRDAKQFLQIARLGQVQEVALELVFGGLERRLDCQQFALPVERLHQN